MMGELPWITSAELAVMATMVRAMIMNIKQPLMFVLCIKAPTLLIGIAVADSLSIALPLPSLSIFCLPWLFGIHAIVFVMIVDNQKPWGGEIHSETFSGNLVNPSE